MIRELTRDGAKVIAFDLLFDTPQPGDAALAAAIQNSGRVLLACGDKGLEQPEILPPEPRLLAAGAHGGIRGFPGAWNDRPLTGWNPVHPGARAAASGPGPQRRSRAHRPWDGWRALPVPADADGTFKIRYLGAPGKTFQTFSYEDILHATPAQAELFSGRLCR